MHQHDHAKVDRMIQCAVLTVSDTRDKETDKRWSTCPNF